MQNQTPHTQSPLSPSPLGRGLGGGLSQKMKPIIIPPEMQDLVKKINELASTVIPELEKSEEENRKRELEKQQNEFIEINGIRLETENLGRPQNPEIQVNQQQASETIPQAWEKDGNWYYNFPGAQAEAKYLGKSIPTKEQWEQICEPFGQDGKKLSKELNMQISGYRYYPDSSVIDQNSVACYWSSSPSTTNNAYSLSFNTIAVDIINNDNRAYGFSVRCIKSETFDKKIFNKVALSNLKEDKKVKKNKRNPFII